MDKRIIFKGDKLTRTKISNNIIKIYKQSNNNNDWYKEAFDFCYSLSMDKGININKVIGIVSALSPRKNWDLNKRIAIDLINTRDCGQIKIFVDKAIRILDSDGEESTILNILNGQKIKSFYMNIKYPESSENVTIDRHAIAVALGRVATDKEQSLTDKHYQFFKDCYVWTANKLGIKPLLLQSITWEIWRDNK